MFDRDPVLEVIFEGEIFETVEPMQWAEYGKGDWPNANIQEVKERPHSEFGRSIQIRANLDGDNKPFNFFVDAPILPYSQTAKNAYRRYAAQLKRLKSIVHATGAFVTFNENGKVPSKEWPRSLNDFSTDEGYDKLLSLFRLLVGKPLGLRVRHRTYTKRDGTEGCSAEVWGLEPRQA